MTSPCESISVRCPKCGLTYEDWWRPSVNLTLDAFDGDYLDEATSATCPSCRTKVFLPVLHVGGSDSGKTPAPAEVKARINVLGWGQPRKRR